MTITKSTVWRSVRKENYPNGTTAGGKPVAGILHPSFQDEVIASGPRQGDIRHKEMRELRSYVASGDDEGQADAQELLLSVENAARELKTAYEHALRMSSNLPSYERLTRDKT